MAIDAARPGVVAGHRQSVGCSWSQEGGFGVPRVAAPSAGRLGLVRSVVRVQRVGPWKIAGGARPTAVLSFGPTPRPPRHGGRPDTAHRSCWRARPSNGSVSTLCSLCQGFRPNSFASMCHTLWTQDAIGNWFFDLVAGHGGTQGVFNFLYVCRPWALARAVQESCGTRSNFTSRRPKQSRLQKLTWELVRVDQRPPKLRAKGAETRHLVPCCFELDMDFHKHQWSVHSLTVRGLFEQLFSLYIMFVEPFDSAACARCSRQFSNLCKALS